MWKGHGSCIHSPILQVQHSTPRNESRITYVHKPCLFHMNESCLHSLISQVHFTNMDESLLFTQSDMFIQSHMFTQSDMFTQCDITSAFHIWMSHFCLHSLICLHSVICSHSLISLHSVICLHSLLSQVHSTHMDESLSIYVYATSLSNKRIMLYYVVLCCIMLYYVVLRCIMLYYVYTARHHNCGTSHT